MQRGRGGKKQDSCVAGRHRGYPPGSTHSRVPRCGGSPPTHSKPAREHPGLARERRSSFCLLRRPGVFPEAPQTLAREGRLQPGFPGKRSAAPFPRVPRGHREWQLRVVRARAGHWDPPRASRPHCCRGLLELWRMLAHSIAHSRMLFCDI